MSVLNLRDLSFSHVAIVALVTILALAGAAEAYDYAAVRRPVAGLLHADARVESFSLVSTRQGAAAVEVTLGPVEDLRTAYEEITAGLEHILGPVELSVRDNRSAETVAFLEDAQFVLYEALHNGAFVVMRERLERLAEEAGVSVRVGITDRHLFLQVESEDGRLYEIIDRDTGRRGRALKAVKPETIIGAAIGALVFMGIRGFNVLPLLFMAGLAGLLLFAPMAGKLGGKRITLRHGARSLVTFGEIGGQTAAKQELLEALDFVNLREKVRSLGIRPLRGVLLSGPPGTGKTMLAKAAASYTDAVFLSTSGSEFIEVYAGVGAQRVRQLFGDARNLAKRESKRTAVVFIDEIEVLAPVRGSHKGHLEYDQTLNQLLVEMDGMRPDDDVQVLIIGATNREDLLDSALLRPGRFDRLVRVGMPDRADRLAVLNLHSRNKPLAPDVDMEEVARSTFGFSGAHLESVCNEAAILALREGAAELTGNHFAEAVDKVIMGERLGRKPSRDELLRIASHEGGHALQAEAAKPGTVASVTIASRGMALGYVRQRPQDDLLLLTKEQLEDNIDAALAGPLAEEMLCGSRSTGAAQDLKVAAETARQLVLSGMTELGPVPADTVPAGVLHRAVRDQLNKREDHVRRFLDSRREVLIALRDRLLEEETLSGDELRSLLGDLGEALSGPA